MHMRSMGHSKNHLAVALGPFSHTSYKLQVHIAEQLV